MVKFGFQSTLNPNMGVLLVDQGPFKTRKLDQLNCSTRLSLTGRQTHHVEAPDLSGNQCPCRHDAMNSQMVQRNVGFL